MEIASRTGPPKATYFLQSGAGCRARLNQSISTRTPHTFAGREHMELLDLLQQHGDAILEDALRSMQRVHLKSYAQSGPDETRTRLRELYDVTVQSISTRRLDPMVRRAETIARERFSGGFDLFEVQTAFNALEEAIWMRIIRELTPAQYAEALGLVGTALGAGKDALARAYVQLASRTHTPTLDVASLFNGEVGA